MAKRQISRPWWLESGSELCSVCSHMYLFETEYRCNDCDGPVCPECIERTRMVCLPCVNTEPETSIDVTLEV